MNIVFSTIYGKCYEEDRLFDNSACKIGQNLLMPNIMLKNELEKNGNEVHTADMFEDFDCIIFHDVPGDSVLTIANLLDIVKYIVKRKWRKDYLLKSIKRLPREKVILQINEPPTVSPKSYKKNYHKYFGKILTWNDDLVDNKNYFKVSIPQYCEKKEYLIPLSERKSFVMIAGNKRSSHKNELYNKRKDIIEYFEMENERDKFDLYGFDWEKENYTNYKGTTGDKLKTLSNYKFCFCYENIFGLNGYITEKIFDCFFAGCVPIYLGAENILDYIPAETFVDVRNYSSIQELINYLESLSESEINNYLCAARQFLNSAKFEDVFSVNAYVKRMVSLINL